jgi:division/cell wall cluster transcriptional repressor MraZ
MAKLRGNAEGTMDAKGRAAVPTRFRGIFEGKEDLVLWEPQGRDQPFLVLTLDEYFDKIYEREYAQADKDERQKLLYDMLGHMDVIELDQNARFVIPEKYFEKAGFAKGEKLFFLANINYIEIWSLQVWKAREAARRGERSLMDYTPDPVLTGIRSGETKNGSQEPETEGRDG